MKETNKKSSSEPSKDSENPFDAAASSIKDKLISKFKVLSEKFKVLYESKFYYICVIGITLIAGIWSLFVINQNNDFAIGLSALLLLPSFYSLYIIYKEGISNHHWKIYYSFTSFFILVYLLVQLLFWLFLLLLAGLILIGMGSSSGSQSLSGGSNATNGFSLSKEREITKRCRRCNYIDTRKAKAWGTYSIRGTGSAKCPNCGKRSMSDVV